MEWLLTSPLLALAAVGLVVFAYLVRLNWLLKQTPPRVKKLVQPWSDELLRKTYKQLEANPVDCTADLPPKLNRRYIVTGGNGLVGGYIVLQLLARGTPPEAIRILDIRETERSDLQTGPAAQVDYIKTDITSPESVQAAFSKAWSTSVASLPLTVFHTAAIIVISERSPFFYRLPEMVNVFGTRNVLDASIKAGADVFSSTSSASVAVRPIGIFDTLWRAEPRHFAQVLDEADFDQPMRERDDFFSNYALSKAVAERMVCDENKATFRTGCIRPGNAVYGTPGDATMGRIMAMPDLPTWIPHVVQSFVHGSNVAQAHLSQEAVLAQGHVPQSGRPFVVTDSGPPVTFGHMYRTIQALSIHPLTLQYVQPMVILLFSHLVEWYSQLPFRVPFLRSILPEVTGDLRTLRPSLFSICTHVILSDVEARKPVAEGGLGYHGTFTTLTGMVTQALEWNREHEGETKGGRKAFTTSMLMADKLEKIHGK